MIFPDMNGDTHEFTHYFSENCTSKTRHSFQTVRILDLPFDSIFEKKGKSQKCAVTHMIFSKKPKFKKILEMSKNTFFIVYKSVSTPVDENTTMTSSNVSTAVCGQGTEFALDLAVVLLEQFDYQTFKEEVEIFI